ncbi:MAG: hypothetical protein JWM87_2636 [Candidatus Eremiobacteraeota bacterium]|nr:hypothetical protein [Candidatus Eremiobacteraeota bacterium]
MYRSAFICFALVSIVTTAAPAQQLAQTNAGPLVSGETFEAQLNGRLMTWRIASRTLQKLTRTMPDSMLGSVTYYGNVVVANDKGTAILFARCDGKPAIAMRSDDKVDKYEPPCPRVVGDRPLRATYQQGLEASALSAQDIRFSTTFGAGMLHSSNSVYPM